MKFGIQSRSSSSIINMIFEIVHLLNIKNVARFGPKIVMCLIFVKFRAQNKSNMLIMNILLTSV